MRVLVAGFDLFRAVGGGQTYYRGAILKNPGIDFYYLRDREPEDAARPANAHPLTYREVYNHNELHRLVEPGPPAWTHGDFVRAYNIAAAAAGCRFDVVDTPDYERLGVFLPGALRRHGVSYGTLALSMHGVLSNSSATNWESDGTPAAWLVRMEHLQYQSADLRYFISQTYRDEWLGRFPDLPTGYLDPMWFFTPPARLPYRDSPAAPELILVGRTERLKGPHLFLDLAWWLPRDSYSTATVIGPDSTSRSGTSSSVYLTRMIEARQLDGTVRLAGPMSSTDLARVFATKAVVVLPSLIDTLNLVALEALFSGCPTVVGSAAGACRYLRERFPKMPFVEFDIHRFYASLPAVEDLLTNYDRRRAELADALRAADFPPQGPPLPEVYATPGASDPAARAECDDWDRRLAAVAAPTSRAA